MTTTLDPHTTVTPIGRNAAQVIAKRYARKDAGGRATEDWADICARVVAFVSGAETDERARETFRERSLALMLERRFLPNTPCLVNAGKRRAQLAACYVLPVGDSVTEIFEHAKICALIHQSGGGTGQSYELVRPAGASVGDGGGVASGPVSFMRVLNTGTETIAQGGVRRGANMGCMRVTHPDILRFVHAKNDQTSLTNFNISVTVTDAFMRAVEREEWFALEFAGEAWREPIFDPKANDGKGGDYTFDGQTPPVPGMVYAPDLWGRMMASAHAWAEPGVIFIDTVNRTGNTLRDSMGEMIATNPCAEEPLHPWNSCNLGSIDVAKYVDGGRVAWDRLGPDVATAVRFLDNVIDVCDWPLPQIEEVVKRTRPVGLGLMGVADLLLALGVAYGSDESLEVLDELYAFVERAAWEASLALGAERGVLPEFEANRRLFERHVYEFAGVSREVALTPRNYEVTTCAPTGTISLAAETSSGLEPNFAWAYCRRDTVGERTYAHPLAAAALGVAMDPSDPESVATAARAVEARHDELPAYFVDAHALSADDHLRVLAVCQRHVDASISKSINAPSSATVEEADRVHRAAWKAGVKAVSYYRDGSREGQVLTASAPAPTSGDPASASAPSVPAANVASSTAAPARVDRGRELGGWTWQVGFDAANLYVTVNHDGGRVLEVFTRGPLSDSVGMLASKMLRGGFGVEEVARSLDKVIGTHSVLFNERFCTSPEQAVAECLRLAARRIVGAPDSSRAGHARGEVEGARSVERGTVRCPSCGGRAEPQGGCLTCRDCGYSKCA